MCQVKTLLREPQAFARFGSNPMLRNYQKGVMDSVCHSVVNQLGLSQVVMFPRQSGKNELQAHIEVYLMTLLSKHPFELVKVTPTVEPQAQIGMRRFEKIARHNLITKGNWKKDGMHGYRIGKARLNFLSAAAGSNIVGATASGLLEVDEAQEVSIQKFDRDISPMAASTCATQVFWGTAWSSKTLLARELRASLEDEKKDGIRRVFRLTADDIYTEVPAYRKHVEEMVARKGRNHPSIRTQYFSEEIDGAGGMFPAERIARMGSSTHSVLKPSSIRALLLDVAGEDEGVRSITGDISLANSCRDATALTLVEIVMDQEEGAGASPARTEKGKEGAPRMPVYRPALKGLPTYRLVRRWQWIGANHTELQAQIRDIALEWNARAVVVDATGVGAGLASFLDRALPGRVTPFTFSSTSKSDLGWRFLEVVDSLRWQEPKLEELPGDDQLRYQNEFLEQLRACQFEVSSDAKHTMKWSVPDGSRNAVSGGLIHDDWVLSAALCAVLEKMDWGLPAESFIVKAGDPLEEMDGKF